MTGTSGLAPVNEREVLRACGALFGSAPGARDELLRSLSLAGVKSEFRKLAFEHHPDRHARESPAEQGRQTERFKQIVEAYALLGRFVEARERGEWSPAPASVPARSEAPRRPDATPWSRGHGAHGPHGASGGPSSSFRVPIGQRLLRQHLITHRDLVEALAWQRAQRPRVGEIAERWQWMSPEEVQFTTRVRSLGLRFGEKAVSFGYIAGEQLDRILWFQRSRQRRLGEYFVELGLVSEQELQSLGRDGRARDHEAGKGFRGRY
ncbi:MAG: DnaJ domain-containing protein [Deltaproteobacteria bacterium]